jgi:flagellar basal-body rod protein FlgG
MPTTFTNILNVTRGSMLSRLLDLDVRSHNLSNINTAGYKRSRANFQEVLQGQLLGGVNASATQRSMDQGSLRETGAPLDLGIQGAGFFAVTLPDGRTAYTRDGQFHLDGEGRLVNAAGFPVDWEGEIPAGTAGVHVNPDGSVMVQQGATWVEAGTIQLARFPHPSGLESYGQNLFLATEISGAAEAGEAGAEGLGQILSGALEASNVNLAEEMTHMLSLQRSFQLSVRTFQNTDLMLAQALQMRRG